MAGEISKILARCSSGLIVFKKLRHPRRVPTLSGFFTDTFLFAPQQASAFKWSSYRMAATESNNEMNSTSSVEGEVKSGSNDDVKTEQTPSEEKPSEHSATEQPNSTSTNPQSLTDESNATNNEEQRPFRVGKKMKVALLLSYSGQGYFGMQIQPNGTKTIENDLMKAFRDAGVIDDEGFHKPKSIHFQRAARTDKNVSAARNIISIMLPRTFDPETVNQHLPDQIRVMDFKKVTRGFDSKLACSSRTYLYMIPTFAFTPLEEPVREDYRITTEVLEKVRQTLKLYEGTKNFHNFTSRKKPTDPSAHRFIMSFTSSDPFLKEGLEYVVLKVKGQSFMLHQIRKMIGLVVAILRGYANEETMQKCFTLDRIDIPMAPGLGLMLGEAHYDSYNKKFGRDGIHEPIRWDNVEDKIEQFCQEKIYTNVTETENNEKSMFQWLSTIPYHSYSERELGVNQHGGFSPIGKASLHVKRVSGELSDEEEQIDASESDDEQPRKKVKHEG